MKCPSCKERMNCRFTTPIGNASRYRIYKCKACESYKETIEVDAMMFPPTTEEVRTLQAALQKARVLRYSFSKRFVKAGATEAAPSGGDD
jgi:hypothetical protein